MPRRPAISTIVWYGSRVNAEASDEFHQFCDDLELEWQPQSRTEQFYLGQMAVSHGKLNRMEVGKANLCKKTVIFIKTRVPLLDRLWKSSEPYGALLCQSPAGTGASAILRRNQVRDRPEEETSASQLAADFPAKPEPTSNGPHVVSVTGSALPYLEENPPAPDRPVLT
jgi:hypothetical protein